MIILTSFQESKRLLKRDGIKSRKPNVYSVARNQPVGFSYPVLSFLAAIDIHGQKIHLRGVEDPINSYKKTLFEYYNSVCDDVLLWLSDLKEEDMDILCCWCPYSEATRNQIRIYDAFVCHTGLIGQLVNELRPDISIYMDGDRSEKLIDEFRPEYKMLGV